ncbi:LOW QUALITY PROTEIN: hypothetical protein LZ30DRAFT_761589 [Colletotrichum cereale]|nr:LOW QUALITY PROTEIN: hypothetical protein LZ30DRAFT_761589 [Colletotrichum cereale]
MPELDEISYSSEDRIATIRDYYSFLTKIYLREEDVLQPPEGGWPSVTPGNLAGLGKTDEVVSLLRHLPYLRRLYSGNDPHGAPYCYFADWQSHTERMVRGKLTGDTLKLVSEGTDLYKNVPPHVISLTSGGRDNPVFLLDTELGIVYWHECPGEIRFDPTCKQDFFEILKDQFITLSFIPIDSRNVLDIYARRYPPSHGWIERVQGIYRHHGWPDLKTFRKHECLEAIKTALQEEFPEF